MRTWVSRRNGSGRTSIVRTTPALFGLFSLVTVLAHRLAERGQVVTRQAAWYAKPGPTFSDALAAVRYELWRQPVFHTSRSNRNIAKMPKAIFNCFVHALCYADLSHKVQLRSVVNGLVRPACDRSSLRAG